MACEERALRLHCVRGAARLCCRIKFTSPLYTFTRVCDKHDAVLLHTTLVKRVAEKKMKKQNTRKKTVRQNGIFYVHELIAYH